MLSCAIGPVRDGGSTTITGGAIPEAMPGSAGGALVDAGLDVFCDRRRCARPTSAGCSPHESPERRAQ
jgi:hypothetical protein